MDNQTVDKVLKEAKELWPRTLPFPDQEKFRDLVFLILNAANRAGYIFLNQEDLRQFVLELKKRIENKEKGKLNAFQGGVESVEGSVNSPEEQKNEIPDGLEPLGLRRLCLSCSLRSMEGDGVTDENCPECGISKEEKP